MLGQNPSSCIRVTKESEDYINARLKDVPAARHAYILTQYHFHQDKEQEDEQIDVINSNKPEGVRRKTEFLEKKVVEEISKSKINQGFPQNDCDEPESPLLFPQNKPSSNTLEERKLSYVSEKAGGSVTSLDTANKEPKVIELVGDDQAITNNTVFIENLSSATEKNMTYAEIRERKRKERIKKTTETVKKMRQKLRDSEAWESQKLLLKKFSIGAVLLLGLGYLVYQCYVQG
ncbi:uncharacterized protein LOC143237800 isoform X2 [Tachypleus tridentatus]|uniref:uncharacterized protein LOC143237800 isoform X2 n=1 Tax=Tachypleus tridentatus TaxID=6853 RepID=UPI003FD37366